MVEKKLSVILLSYYSKEKITDSYRKLKDVLEREKIDFEFIVMDDGSTDESFELALALENSEANVRAYQLSRNYTSTYSIFAGLSVSTGDCVTVIPDDEQVPYGDVVRMYRSWETGEKSVFLFRDTRQDGRMNRTLSVLFYNAMNLFSHLQYPKGGTDTFLIDRELVDILNAKIHPVNTSIITEIFRLGFKPVFLAGERPKGVNGKSRWSMRKKIKYALDIFYSSSSLPIRFISFLGLFFSVISFLMILFYSYVKLFGNETFWGYYPPGWTSVVLFIAFFSGLILLALGVIAQYIWRIFEEVKGRPGFIIKKK